MNKIVILNDSVQLYEHYISDDKWEKVLSFPRGGLTYLVSNGTIKFYAFEDYLYRNTLMSMPLPVHVTDEYAGIDGEISDMDELTEALDRIFPTNDVDAELDEYLKKDEAQETYQPLGDYITTEELSYVLDDYYEKDDVDDLLDLKMDASGMTDYYTKDETDDTISDAIEEAVSGKADTSAVTEAISAATSGKADTSAVTAVSDALTAHVEDAGIHVTPEEKNVWNAKLDASAYTPTDLSNYYTKDEIEDKHYLTEHQHLKTINGESLVGDGNIVISGGSGDLSNYYTKSETDDLLDDKLDATAYTPVDLSEYWTSGETQEAITKATSGIPSSQTIEELREDVNTLSGDVETIKNGYVTITVLNNYISGLQEQIDNLSDAIQECCGYVPSGETQYRTVSGTPYCSGYDKVVDVTYQVSHDSGQTWANISSSTTVMEEDSVDCGFTNYMLYGVRDDGGHVTLPCNGSGTINEEDTLGKLSRVVSVTIGDCITAIGDYALDRETISSVTMHSGITSIGAGAFEHTSITAISIPSGVTAIGSSAFQACTGLTSITFPDGVETVTLSVCQDCSALQTAVLGSSVTKIQDRAFMNCSSLQSVTVNAVTPPTMVGYDMAAGKIFENTNNCPIYVPAASVEAYKAANGWSVLADRIQAIQ